MTRLLGSLILVALMLLSAAPASGHFSQGAKLRTIVVTLEERGLIAYLRTPAPLLFADVIVQAQIERRPFTTPFLEMQRTPAGPQFWFSLDAVEANADAFATTLENAFAWQQNGQSITAEVLSWRVADEPAEDDTFTTADEARTSLARPNAEADPLFGVAVIEAAFRLAVPIAQGPLTIRSALPPMPLPPDVTIDNHLVDARAEPPRSITEPGQLEADIVLDGSLWRTVLAFLEQGVIHIIEGLDHVLLVVCLALGVGFSSRLLWLVTAFTLGHSVTLVTTFLGAAPAWPWFVPAVEALIAASVLYAAIAAWRGWMSSVWMITEIGLLHGLGFSFVLGDILGREAPGLIEALAAFNVGVEVGQIIILAITLAVVFAVSQFSKRATVYARGTALVAIAVVAAYWTVERALSVV